VLALRGGDSSQAVAIIGFDGDLAAAFASRAGKGNYVNNVRSATENSLGGEDDSRPSQTRLGAGRRAEIELDDVTRRQQRAKRVRPYAAGRRGHARWFLVQAAEWRVRQHPSATRPPGCQAVQRVACGATDPDRRCIAHVLICLAVDIMVYSKADEIAAAMIQFYGGIAVNMPRGLAVREPLKR